MPEKGFLMYVDRSIITGAMAALIAGFVGGFATLAQACPNPGLIGQTVTFRISDLLRPQTYGVTAGGATRIETCGFGFGAGYADARPQLTLDLLDTARGALLDLRVLGTCDTVMLVNDPMGRWSFSDDADGALDPHLSLDGVTAGQYDIWVGTYGPTPCSATLIASASGAQQAPSAPPPQFTPQPQPQSPARAQSSRYELVVVPEGITFEAARQRAASMGGHLATITSADELQAIFAVANNPAAWFSDAGRFQIGPWLGGYRQGDQWMWVTGEPWAFSAWGPGQPDNSRGRESHLNFWAPGNSPAPLFNDAPPDALLRGFVVEFTEAGMVQPQPATPTPAPAQAARFELVVVPEGITFEAARQRAASMGGHLATITSADELQAIFAVANNPAAWSLELDRYLVGPWLGGYRQGDRWTWITGEPFGFTAWAPGQPDNYQGRETHMNMWVRGTSPAPLLNDADPNVPLRGFVVEYPPADSAPAAQAPFAPPPQTGFFAEAWYSGERVDHCLYYARDCGQDAADRFCQHMGYIYAVDGAFSHVMTSRTLVLGDNRICTIPNGCGHLVNVTCVPSPEALGETGPTPQVPGIPVK